MNEKQYSPPRDEGRREMAIMNDLKAVLELPEGRRVLGRILDNTYRDRTTLIIGSFEHTAFLEGMRQAGNILANSIREIDPLLLAECEIATRDFEKYFHKEEETDE